MIALEFKEMVEVSTPKGDGVIWYMMDYGPHYGNIVFGQGCPAPVIVFFKAGEGEDVGVELNGFVKVGGVD